MRYKNIFALAFLGLSLCVSGEYFIEITPNNESGFYEMKVDEVVTFRVAAYEKSQNSNVLISLDNTIWWEYNRSLLEKVSSDAASITLKAVSEGNSELSATTIVKNSHCLKKINILIIK
jgi:hypothetical protein